MNNKANFLSISAIVISIFVAITVFSNQSKSSPSVELNSNDSIQIKHLAQAMGYSWHPIILEERSEGISLSLSMSTSGEFNFQAGGSLPKGNLFLFYRVIDSKLEYSIVGDNGRLSSSHQLTGLTHNTTISKPSGEPIKIKEIIMAMGEGQASLSHNKDLKQIQIALVSKG